MATGQGSTRLIIFGSYARVPHVHDEAPSTKLQTPNKHQGPKHQAPNTAFGAWNLVLGIWDLVLSASWVRDADGDEPVGADAAGARGRHLPPRGPRPDLVAHRAGVRSAAR